MPIKKKSSYLKSLSNFLWPIEPEETLKCLLLIALVFLISFNYTILKALKDPLIITAENSTALVLPFLKTWAVLPSALIGATLFTWLCNRFGFQKTFYVLISFFLAYFILFTFILYPNKDSIYLGSQALLLENPSASKDSWLNYSAFFRTFFILLYYWPLSTFYVMAELWSSIVLSVLFWGFANHITPLYQAKRFYGVINLLGNVSGFVAGMVSYYFNTYSQDNLVFNACCAWDHTLYGLMALIIISSILILGIFHFTYKKFPSPNEVTFVSDEQKSSHMGMREAFAKCFQSKYIFSIAFIVLAYNLSMNILEILWKDQTNVLYPKVSDYHNYMSYIAMLLGVFSIIFGLAISTFLQVFKWKNTALFTPLILSLTSILFFFAFFLHYFGYSSFFDTIGLSGLTPLAVVVFTGGIQNSLCRSAKFTFFDTTKELAFIPLSKDDKIKAKAVIDGVGSRLGKSGGAIAVQVLVLFLPTVSAMAPFFLVLLIPMLSGWFYSIRHISNVFENSETEEEGTSNT